MTAPGAEENASLSTEPEPNRLGLECRPKVLFAALYNELPFPNLGPVQEVAFDLGITAIGTSSVLVGVVIRAYAGHQLLFEQRWPERFIRRKTGLNDLEIPEGTGIALRSMLFQIHGYEPIDMIELTAVGKRLDTEEDRQAALRVPVEHPQQKTDLHFPLSGTWWAIHGADWTDLHKQEVVSQPYALDFVKLGHDSQIFRGDGMVLEDHESWNQPVYAAAGGKVAYAAYDMPDQLPGAPPDPRIFRNDPRRLLGNAVAVSHGNGEFAYYAHLQEASLYVRYGDMVRRGQLLGRVGSSGQSPGPHLHFHLMNGPNLQLDQGLPMKISHFSAAGQFYEQPVTIPSRMIVTGPVRTAVQNDKA